MLLPKLGPAQAQLDAPMKTLTRKRRILVVDDDVAYARLLVELLSRAGYDVSATHTAQDAIGAVVVSAPDLALVDVRLPGDSGLILGAALHSRFDVAFVILSGLDDLETAQQAAQIGAIAYLVKTGDLHHYLPAIHTALARSEELRELRRREAQLSNALQQTRAVSAATGVMMERSCLSREQAFERLRGLARTQRRRLSDVAEQFLTSVECLNGGISAMARSSGEVSKS
jgi:AmiR/NasT family two-component response regulator